MTKEKFMAYVAVQNSGVTNMFAVTTVMELSGLEKAEVLDIMQNYAKYKEMYAPNNK